MFRNHFKTLLSYVRQKIEPLANSDADLLRRFTQQKEESAFNELLSRHAAYVWSICRRHLVNEQDAEDAFQATFIVFAQQAYQVRKSASIRSWLHSVAYRMVCKRRNTVSKTISPRECEIPSVHTDLLEELSWNQVRSILDEELARLPDQLRAPILLCYFDGHTQEEASTILGWKKRTVKARIQRGRLLLQKRLTRRGIDLSAIFVGSLATHSFARSTRFIDDLSRNARAIAWNQNPDTGISSTVLQLVKGGSMAMSKSIWLLSVACLLILFVGTGYLVSQTSQAEKEKSDPVKTQVEGQSKRLDFAGDPLPKGAIARLGSVRFRHPSVGFLFFSPNGKELIHIPEQGSAIGVFDVETGKLIKEISMGSQWTDSAIISPDGSLIATFSYEATEGQQLKHAIRLRKSDTRETVLTIPVKGPPSMSLQMRFSPDGKKLITGYQTEITIFDVLSGEILIRQKAEGGINGLAISVDGKTIYWAKYDLYAWNLQAGKAPRKLCSLKDSVGGPDTEQLYCTPDGKSILSTGDKHQIHKLDLTTGKRIRSYSVKGLVRDLQFSQDGKELIVGYHGNPRIIDGTRATSSIDLESGKEIRQFGAGGTHLVLSRDGKRLAGGDRNCIRVWDYETAKPVSNVIDGHSDWIENGIFLPDDRIVTGSNDSTVRIWNSTNGKPLSSWTVSYWVRDLSVSPDGRWIAMSGLENDLRVWDSQSGKERFRLLGNGEWGSRRTVQFTPDGKKLIAFGDDWYLRVWDTKNGKLLSEHLLRPSGIDLSEETDRLRREMGQSIVSPDGHRLILASGDMVYLFDVHTGKEEATFRIADTKSIESLACSADGKRLLLGGLGAPVKVQLPNGLERTVSAKVHPITLVDLETRNPIRTIWSEGYIARAIRFSPDQKQFATISRDHRNEIHFFHTETGKQIGRIPLDQGANRISFDPEGKRLFVGLTDASALIYDLSLAAVKTED